jgi:DNA-nicking Smr family endonuclease
MSRKRRNLTPDEQSLWDRFVQKIKPIPSDKRPITPKPAKPRTNRPTSSPISYPPNAPKVHALTSHRIDRVRKVEIDARLDLHGYTMEQAQARLVKFLMSCQRNRCLWVLIITGKGKPDLSSEAKHSSGSKKTLRSQVPHWLEDAQLHSIVSAYTTAKPQDGGTGALYVRLKRLK